MDKLRAGLLPIFGIVGLNSQELEEWAFINFLSPLHMEVILGNRDQVVELLKIGVNLDARDRRLWTPLHHAALFQDFFLIDLLLERGANPTLLNDYKGTYLDILNQTTYVQRPPKEMTPYYFQGNQLSIAEYETLTHSHYITESITHPKWLIELWKLPYTSKKGLDESGFFEKVKKEYHYSLTSYQNIPTENFTLASATPESSMAGLGVFSLRRYLPFEPLGEYIGEIDLTKSNYAIEFCHIFSGKLVINSKKYGNAISRINDGFPNLISVRLQNSKGLPFRFLLLAIEEIEPGDQLCFDYGDHVIKNGPYIELRKKELREFIVKYDVADWNECLRKVNLFLLNELTLGDLRFMVKFTYLLHSPSVVFSLVLDKTIEPEKGQQILDVAVSQGMIKPYDHSFFQSIIPIASRWLAVTKTKKKSQAEAMTQEMLALIETMPFRTAALLIDKASESENEAC